MISAFSSAPISPPATEEATYGYQYISSELGTPWDIILLTDVIMAEQKGDSSIEDYNPLLTSLEFCIIEEKIYEWIETEVDNEEVNEDDEQQKNENVQEPKEVVGEWVLTGSKLYYGKDNILKYINTSAEMLYTEVAKLIADINYAASMKSNQTYKYEPIITVNDNYEDILRKLNLTEENISRIIELSNSNYLMYLYGYDEGIGNINIQLPEVTVGNITRNELVQVASTLINHPYLFGGKSNYIGVPKSPLDCSGFIDWVYIQCFGKGVSNGSVPNGVGVSGTAMQYYASREISEIDLKVGDLGFYYEPSSMNSGQINHVGIYIGKINGKNAFIHSGGKSFGYKGRPNGRVVISINSSGYSNSYNLITGSNFEPAAAPTKFSYFRRPNFKFLDD